MLTSSGISDAAHVNGITDNRYAAALLVRSRSTMAPGMEVGEGLTSHTVWIPAGSFLMGSDDFYPEERPRHRATVDGFWMDAYPVTVEQFRRFVECTGYVTVAERRPDAAHYPGVDPSLLMPGSLVFCQPAGRVPLADPRRWWRYVPGACWHHPEGAGSTVNAREQHPVTHVAYEDARAFARWSGKALPTEAEWERAARGGVEGATYPWGEELAPGGRRMANTWQGEFPWQNLAANGFDRTSPVGSFPPNGYGLYDMVGNVWEWTADIYAPYHAPGAASATACCTHRVAAPAGRVNEPAMSRHVVKGGSHLCAPNYCRRYRPAAREGQTVDTSASHIGFRCVVRDHDSKEQP